MSKDQIIKKVSIASETEALEPQRKWLFSILKEYEYCEDDIFAIHLALEEAFFNAVKHGNKMDSSKKVDIKFIIDIEKIEIIMTDYGDGFRPDSVPDCRKGENLYKTNGRGIFLIRSYMDKVDFNDKGNAIHMVRGSRKAKQQTA